MLLRETQMELGIDKFGPDQVGMYHQSLSIQKGVCFEWSTTPQGMKSEILVASTLQFYWGFKRHSTLNTLNTTQYSSFNTQHSPLTTFAVLTYTDTS